MSGIGSIGGGGTSAISQMSAAKSSEETTMIIMQKKQQGQDNSFEALLKGLNADNPHKVRGGQSGSEGESGMRVNKFA